jgi:hypothetical protein
LQLAAPAGQRGGLVMPGVPQTGGCDGRGFLYFAAGTRASSGNLLDIDILISFTSSDY